MNFLSLFSGIGGIDLGLERAAMTCVGQVEIEPFCRAVLAKHWPEVRRWEDVRAFSGKDLHEPVDLVCGGFPCQDISTAGKGAGLAGERSGLWWEMRRIIDEIRPAWVLAENVPALRTRGYDDVANSLEGLGYTVRPFVVGAWAIGATHKRDRVWIVADAPRLSKRESPDKTNPIAACREARNESGNSRESALADTNRIRIGDADQLWRSGRDEFARSMQLVNAAGIGCDARGAEPAEQRRRDTPIAGTGASGELADTHVARSKNRLSGTEESGCKGQSKIADDHRQGFGWPAGPGQPQHDWEAPRLIKLPLGGTVDGLPVRLVRFANRNAVRAYGNAVVPQIVEVIGRWIMAADAAPHAESEVAA